MLQYPKRLRKEYSATMNSKILSLLLSAILLLFALCACKDTSDNADTNNTENKGVNTEMSEIQNPKELEEITDFSSYRIVRSDTSSDAEKDALVALHTAIRKKTGVLLNVATDYSPEQKYEILVGKTNRSQSADAAEGLAYADYVIKQVGNSIVIVGGSNPATATAVDFFIENYINEENKSLMIPQGDGLVFIKSYTLTSFKIDGVDVGEFRIKASASLRKDFRDKLMNTYIGKNLDIEENEMTDGEHYIVIDASSLSYSDYSIEVKDGNLYISGSARSVEVAVGKLYEMMDNAAGGAFELTADTLIKDSIEVPEIPYKNKDELLKVLQALQNSHELVFGQHLAGSMYLNAAIEEYTNAVGEGPGVMDIDMLNLHRHTKETWSALICEAIEYAAKGGIITTMHHWQNPLHPESGFRGRLDSIEQWTEVLTPGTELNTAWHKELDRAAEFLKALDDAGVSVMFRPMHEANGNWFWFCAGYGDLGNISKENMAAMWKYVYNYYTEDCGLDNLLWSYSPNNSNSETSPLPVDYYYPGDEYVDVVGLDWYTGGEYEIDGKGKSWEKLLEYGMPTGLCEWGIGDSMRTENSAKQSELWSCKNYVDVLEMMRYDEKYIAFAEVYSGMYGSVAYVGNGEAIANYKYIISLEEMPEFIKKVLSE